MTRADIERRVAESRAACGLPARVADPLALARIAAVLGQQPKRKGSA